MAHQCSSSSSFSQKRSYDVFLSFYGKDTRYGFTGNLYKTLRERGIPTFMDDSDDTGLKSGEEIKSSLDKAIEESKIVIVVFSENYALSRFCLDELVKIINGLKEKGQLALPVFYKVTPSQIRHQTGRYQEALAEHERSSRHKPEKVEEWRSALWEAANLSGYHFEDNGPYEHVFIEKIVKRVSTIVNHTPLYVVDYPVGLDPRVHEINSLLNVGYDDGVKMVGIYGMGGSGKSTIARAVYNNIAYGFEGLCFISNVREKSIKQGGLAKLQKALLSELTGERDINIGDIYRGIPVLKDRLNQKKVLIVLDDIDKPNQLQALAGGVDWFGSGSRIIITTRDKRLLDGHGIEKGYHMEMLNHEEALELFKWKAFKNDIADPTFQAILERAVNSGHGLPLALEVIGSNLYGKTINEWELALDEYEESSDEEIQKIFEVSYNDLKQREKDIFLDIACFFNGEMLQHVETILLHSRGFCPDNTLRVLVEKSLIKINFLGKLKYII